MARVAGSDRIEVAPTNNAWTALAAAACVVVILGLVALFIRANAVGVNLLKF